MGYLNFLMPCCYVLSDPWVRYGAQQVFATLCLEKILIIDTQREKASGALKLHTLTNRNWWFCHFQISQLFLLLSLVVNSWFPNAINKNKLQNNTNLLWNLHSTSALRGWKQRFFSQVDYRNAILWDLRVKVELSWLIQLHRSMQDTISIRISSLTPKTTVAITKRT